MRSCGNYFLEKVQKWKSVFGLRRRVRIAYEPIPWSAQGDQKIEEKNNLFQNRSFQQKKTKIFKQRAPKGLQKGDFISGVAPLGTPLEPQADFWFKKWAHNSPQSAPGTETKCSKMIPKV